MMITLYKNRTIEEQRAFNTAAARRWRARHPEYAKKSLTYWQRNPKKRSEARLKFRLKKRCWTIEKYEKATREQKEICAICQEKHRLYPDHNHKTKTSRALLCRNCNFGLGNFKDNVMFLANAGDYVKKWRISDSNMV